MILRKLLFLRQSSLESGYWHKTTDLIHCRTNPLQLHHALYTRLRFMDRNACLALHTLHVSQTRTNSTLTTAGPNKGLYSTQQTDFSGSRLFTQTFSFRHHNFTCTSLRSTQHSIRVSNHAVG